MNSSNAATKINVSAFPLSPKKRLAQFPKLGVHLPLTKAGSTNPRVALRAKKNTSLMSDFKTVLNQMIEINFGKICKS